MSVLARLQQCTVYGFIKDFMGFLMLPLLHPQFSEETAIIAYIQSPCHLPAPATFNSGNEVTNSAKQNRFGKCPVAVLGPGELIQQENFYGMTVHACLEFSHAFPLINFAKYVHVYVLYLTRYVSLILNRRKRFKNLQNLTIQKCLYGVRVLVVDAVMYACSSMIG